MKLTPVRLLGMALLALLGVWAGLTEHSTRSPSESAAIRTPAGEAGPRSDSSDLDETLPLPKIPASLPPFQLRDLSGKSTPSSAWQGHPLVLNFWATWCGPCRREIPLLNSLSSEWAAKGVDFVGIAVDYPEKVRQFAAEYQIGYALLAGEQDALDLAAQVGMASPVFPFTVFTDHKGDVIALFIGELHRAQADLILETVAQLERSGGSVAAAQRRIADGLNALAGKKT